MLKHSLTRGLRLLLLSLTLLSLPTEVQADDFHQHSDQFQTIEAEEGGSTVNTPTDREAGGEEIRSNPSSIGSTVSAEAQNELAEFPLQIEDKIEAVEKQTQTIQDAIRQQQQDLTQKIQDAIPQEEIKQVNELAATVQEIGDFFAGLNFDDFFGGINLKDIFDNLLSGLGIGGGDDHGRDIPNSSGSNSDSATDNSEGNDPGINGGSRGGLSINTGDLGLPDPEAVKAAIEAGKTNPTEEILGAKTGGEGSVVIKDDIRTLFTVDLGREVAQASALTDVAQERLKKKTQVSAEALKKSEELAEDSEGQDVTQNIMRNLSNQIWHQQKTDSILAINAQIQQRDAAIANTLLAESLRELNGERIAKNRETAAAYSATLTHGALFTLPGIGEEAGGVGELGELGEWGRGGKGRREQGR